MEAAASDPAVAAKHGIKQSDARGLRNEERSRLRAKHRRRGIKRGLMARRRKPKGA